MSDKDSGKSADTEHDLEQAAHPEAPIDPVRFKSLPHTRGRLATEEDIRQGKAIFHIAASTGQEGSDASPAELDLPLLGVHHQEGGQARPGVLIQAEHFKGETIVGLRYLDGGKGVCTLAELELVDAPDQRFDGISGKAEQE